MGIARGAARLLLAESRTRPFSGSVLQLGRQQIYFSWQELSSWAASGGFKLPQVPRALSHLPASAAKNHIDDGTLFRALGFSEVSSCDISNYESPTYQLDLNVPVPPELHQRFDLIFDGGTAEHVFNLPHVLANVHAMLKVNGRIVHSVPSTNHVDHGFYMFSPTLFFDYYATNCYEISPCFLYQYTPRHDVDPWKVYPYEPGSIDHLSYGGFDKGLMLGVWFTATKRVQSTAGVSPVQGAYRAMRSAMGPYRPVTAEVIAHV